jgi:hypothetical protein
MTLNWNAPLVAQQTALPFAQLTDLFSLEQFTQWPNALGLNQLKSQILADSLICPDFVCQSQLIESAEYYEQIIYQYKRVPTRPDSWHDLFNGLIWLQFPKTKGLLNQQHIEDINQYGLNPRTLRRNNLTHFDECGVILAVEEGFEFLLEALSQHQWHSVFVKHRALWGDKIHSVIFGHANLEMLLHPFIGLTGKWLGLTVDPGFSQLPCNQQRSALDDKLFSHISQSNLFSFKKPLLPIPLLGIPEFCSENEQATFYQNTDYFRPKSVWQAK